MYTIHEKCLKISTALNIVSFIISFLNFVPQPWKMLERQYIFYEHGLNKCLKKVNRPVSGLSCRFVCGHFREQFWTWNELRLCEKQQQNWREYAREQQWEKYFRKVRKVGAGSDWSEMTQNHRMLLPKQKQQTFPIKQKVMVKLLFSVRPSQWKFCKEVV